MPDLPAPHIWPDDGAASRPTILFVSPVADLKGGAERVLVDLMANPGIRAALAVPGEGQLATLARDLGYPVRLYDLGAVAAVRRPPRPGDLVQAAAAAWRCARQLAHAAQELDAAALHTNGLKAHVVGSLVRLTAGRPVVAHVHDIPHTRLEKAIWAGIARIVRRTLIVSPPCYPAAKLPPRVAVLPNGIRPGPLPAPRLPSAQPTIGFVGRFHPFKGVDLLLDWFAAASATRSDLRLLIRGRADDEGAAYWHSLQPRVDALVAQGRCQVLGWAGPGEDPYAGIDILTVPSRAPDPSPLVVLEAMGRGIPVIGYPSGGIPGLIGGPAHGALARDATEFAAALDRLLTPTAYQAAAHAGAARVRQDFTIERFWQAIDRQYALAGLPVQPALPAAA